MKAWMAMLMLGVMQCALCSAQNLVPNPSFEEFSSCIDSTSGEPVQVYRAVGWQGYSRTPDYLNACLGSSCAKCVPDNTFAWQQPQDGDAYMGVYTYCDSEPYRELIGAELLEPLTIGQTYYASFWANYAGEKPEQLSNVWAANRIGILLTNEASYLPDNFDEFFGIRNFAQVSEATVLSDTAAWVLVSGSFVADSGYQYLVIGNHFDDANTEAEWMLPGETGCAYYFVDELCISMDPLGCPLAMSTMEAGDEGVRSWPNPASTQMNVWSAYRGFIEVHDGCGRLVHTDTLVSSNWILDPSQWPTGSYSIRVIGSSTSQTRRVIVVH